MRTDIDMPFLMIQQTWSMSICGIEMVNDISINPELPFVIIPDLFRYEQISTPQHHHARSGQGHEHYPNAHVKKNLSRAHRRTHPNL